MSVLHLAAAKGHEEMVCSLLAAGADVNATDEDGKTVLDLVLKPTPNTISDMLNIVM